MMSRSEIPCQVSPAEFWIQTLTWIPPFWIFSKVWIPTTFTISDGIDRKSVLVPDTFIYTIPSLIASSTSSFTRFRGITLWTCLAQGGTARKDEETQTTSTFADIRTIVRKTGRPTSQDIPFVQVWRTVRPTFYFNFNLRPNPIKHLIKRGTENPIPPNLKYIYLTHVTLKHSYI